MFCPLCMQAVPDDFALRPSEDIRVLINQTARFRKQCNAFFIDLVLNSVLQGQLSPCSAIILHRPPSSWWRSTLCPSSEVLIVRF
ncbi:E3 ubiquitin-protein ligase rnf213-alpha-like [Salvelinus sp. IW2-2015]|uniref:E3 ubiquitin-protein ligase rnf213-alpha-like n=1 Tax=Salvelinus sp. IW2-2015 TaxID=2691554 RepID=UPI0038D4C893